MNFKQFMSELYKIALEHIKKQGPVVVLVIFACLYFYKKLDATEEELKIESKEFRNALDACNDQREKLAVKVASMEVQIASYIQTQSVRKR